MFYREYIIGIYTWNNFSYLKYITNPLLFIYCPYLRFLKKKIKTKTNILILNGTLNRKLGHLLVTLRRHKSNNRFLLKKFPLTVMYDHKLYTNSKWTHIGLTRTNQSSRNIYEYGSKQAVSRCGCQSSCF